ncbi:MAG: Gfo/Idh/MocA family oxidoreductase, partial [Verrucomicrobiales bacterium]|nr:Gfo/Idh/MocA family oxidoreductase [Verrucomicrobiales bacterium]
SRLFGQSNAAPSRRLNVAAIGTGSQWGGHRNYILGQKNLQLTWVCDVDAGRRKSNVDTVSAAYAKRDDVSAYNGVRQTGDFREALADPDVDVVWICTPDHWHALTLIAAAQAGKHIYVEKPLSRAVAEGRAMVRAVRRAGVVCQVGCQQRSSRECRRAVALARMGVLGDIKTVRVGLPGGGGNRNLTWAPSAPPADLDFQMWLGPTPDVPYMPQRVHYEWRWNYAYAGGQLTDWINHHYDMAQLMYGVSEVAPVAIHNASASFGNSAVYDTATEYSFAVEYPGNKIIEVSNRYWGGVEMIGSEGWIKVTRGGIEHSSQALKSLVVPAGAYDVPGRAADGHQQNFIDAILNGLTPRAPILHAHYTALPAHLANAAFRAGVDELRWDAGTERVTNSDEAQRLLACDYRAPWALADAEGVL